MIDKNHWNHVYAGRATDTLSWNQRHAQVSLAQIAASRVAPDAPIIDVGGGTSSLTADLLARGHSNLWVLDLSAKALALAREALGGKAAQVNWIEADVCEAPLPDAYFRVWHDRAVFHFLTTAAARALYVTKALQSLVPGGHLIIATFAEDGPEQCSGLPVMRYRADDLAAQFAPGCELVSSEREAHHTPTGALQSFVYCHLRRVGA